MKKVSIVTLSISKPNSVCYSDMMLGLLQNTIGYTISKGVECLLLLGFLSSCLQGFI
ncbi:hypothetical protein bcgnr5372_39050 [Bacillus luti]